MKKRRSASRRPRSDSLSPRLAAYATTGKAALAVSVAVSATAAAHGQTIVNLTASSFTAVPTSANGTVFGSPTVPGPATTPATTSNSIYHKEHLAFNLLGPANVNGGVVNLGLRAVQHNRISTSSSSPPIRVASGYGQLFGGYMKFRAQNYAPLNFSPNVQIKAAGNGWRANPEIFKTYGTGATTANFNVGQAVAGNFAAGANGILGFGIRKSAGHYYYGWVRIKATVNGDGRPVTLEFVADGNGIYGAYNSTLDGGILAGQLAAIPEPASVAAGLALFALGAAGVREHRRRKKAAA